MSVFACSDLHGMFDLYQEITNFLKPEDKVYCLGDCGDRGPQPWETIKAIATDPQFIYIKGNHEDMLVNAMQEYLRYEQFGREFNLLASNGGGNTILEWINEGAKVGWLRYLQKLPLYLEYKNKDNLTIMLCHAGLTPGKIMPINDDLLWDREHFFEEIEDEGKNSICVHGHTPIPLMIKRCGNLIKFLNAEKYDGSGAFWYCHNHKVNIDTGAYASGSIVLLDLDTFDEHIFSI